MARPYGSDEILADLRRVAALVGGPLSYPRYRAAGGRIGQQAVTRHFGSWLRGLAAAGLESPYQFGGLWFDCPICGSEFRSDNGKKARKTCSPSCTRALQSRHSATYKGAAASKSAARGRALKFPLEPCERCGHDGSARRIERHHDDGNVYNNDRSNIAMLCILCHKTVHGRRGERHARAKLSDAEIQEAAQLRREGAQYKILAHRYRVHPSYLSRLLRGLERRTTA